MILLLLPLWLLLSAQERVSFPTSDGGKIVANIYEGKPETAVVLTHGGRFNKESWDKQARIIAAETGFRVLALDFRGYGRSTGPRQRVDDTPLHNDVLGAVRYLREKGAKKIYAVGGSMGGAAIGEASLTGEIDRAVYLGATPESPGDKLRGRKLFIVTRNDLGPSDIPRLPKIQQRYNEAHRPKKLVILEGSAHAQYIFDTPQGEQALREILLFLRKR